MSLSAKSALHNVLARYGTDRFHIEYETYKANHLLHAVVALHGLQASEERLTSYAEAMSTRLEPARPSEGDLDETTWKEHIGKRRRFLDLNKFFSREIASRGVSGTLAHYLRADLLDGSVSCAALHPVIHLGYALMADRERDVADGLAYMAFGNRPPRYASPPDDVAVGDGSSGDVCAEVRRRINSPDAPLPPWASACLGNASAMDKQPAGGLLCHPLAQLLLKMRQDVRLQRLTVYLKEQVNDHLEEVVAATKASRYSNRLFIILDTALPILQHYLDESGLFESVSDDEKLKELFTAVEQGALVAYASSSTADDFFLLHGVTAAFAIKSVMPHLASFDERRAMLRIFCRGLLAVYIIQDMPELVAWRVTDDDLPSWDTITAETIRKTDEHLIKVVFSCKRLEAEHGKTLRGVPLYRAVAAYKSGVLPWPR